MQAFSPPPQYTHSSIKCVTDEGVGRLVSDFVSIQFDYRNNPTTSQELFTYEVCQFLKVGNTALAKSHNFSHE